MEYYLGIDAGGSKSTAMLSDEHGRKIACAVGDALNVNAVGLAKAKRNLADLVSEVTRGMNGCLPAAFIGLSSLTSRADDAFLRRLCGGILPLDKVTADSDLYIALCAMGVEGPAAVAVCGTGSMAICRTKDGAVQTAGGWGWRFGDEGSGYALARRAVQRTLWEYETGAARSLLAQKAERFLGASDRDALVKKIYDPGMTPGRLAAFAPCFFEAAEEGDRTAREIMNEEARAFAHTVATLLHKLPADAPLGLWGGIFEHHENFRMAFCEALHQEGYRPAPALLPQPPVCGAVWAARHEFGGTL